MRRFFSILVGIIIAAASMVATLPYSRVQAAGELTCQPFDVTYAIDNSGSMDDHGSDKVLFNKLVPRLKDMFGPSSSHALSTDIASELLTFSYYSGETVRTPVTYSETDSTTTAIKRIANLSFGADDSKIGPAILEASDDARQRFMDTTRVQIVIVAGDEQTDPLSPQVEKKLTENFSYSKSDKQTQAPGVKFYTFALNNDGAGRYKKIADLTGGKFFAKSTSDPDSDPGFNDGIGYPSFYQQIKNDICNMKVSIDGRIYDSVHATDLNGWSVALYEEGQPTPIKTIQTAPNSNDATNYHFTDLNPTKKYRVVPISQATWTQTTPDDTFATPLDRPERNFGFKQDTNTQCVGLQLLPSSADYTNDDVFRVQANLTNKSSRNDKGQLTIPALPGISILTGATDVTPLNQITVTKQADGSTVLTTVNDLVPAQTMSIYWRYQVDSNAVPGDRTLKVDAKMMNCPTSASAQIRIGIYEKPVYDLTATVTPNNQTVSKNDALNMSLTVKNTGQTGAVGAMTQTTMLVPKGLTLLSLGLPNQTWSQSSYDTTRNQIVFQTPLGSNQQIDYSLSFKNDLDPAGSPFTVTATSQFTDVGMHNRDIDLTNNAASATINIFSMTLSKVWTDTNTTEARTLGANAPVSFTVKITNSSGSPLSGYYLTDFDSVVCDPAYPASCTGTASDGSMIWGTPTGSPKTVNGRFVWGPVTVNGNSVATYTVTGKTADSAALQQKLAQYGPQQRCNTFGLSDASGVLTGPTAKVCWKYDLPADLAVSKTFGDGVTKTTVVKQGEAGTFIISVKNQGQNAAVNTTLTDTILEASGTSVPFITWTEGSVEQSGGVALGDQKAQWDLGTIQPNETKTVSPGYVIVPCNDGSGQNTLQSPTRRFINNAIATTDSNDIDRNNNTNNYNVSAVVISGYYKLGLSSSVDKTEVVRLEPGNDTVKVTYQISNIQPANQQPTINVAVPGVTVRASLPLDQFDVTLSDDGQIVNGKAVWDVGSVGINQTLTRTATMKAKATAQAGDITFGAEAVSVSANTQKTCGYDTDEGNKVTVKLAGLYTTKALPVGADKDIELGKSVSYDLSVVNNSGVTFTDPFTLSDTLAVPLSFDRIESCIVTNDMTKQQAGCPVPQTSISGSTISWSTVNPLAPKTTVTYRLTAKTDPTYQPAVCPIPVDNTVVLKNNNGVVHTSAPATINLYASRCFNGNIYAQTSADGLGIAGVTIQGSDIIVDSNSIVASKNGIECIPSNNSCNNLKYKIQGYGVNSAGSAIAFDVLKNRIIRTENRLFNTAEGLGTSALSGNFNIQGDAIKFPQGRVWKTSGDLTINTPLKIAGRGTIVVNGNLMITGNGTIEYCDATFANCSTDSSSRNAIGFLVKKNVTIGENVTKLVGGYVAPEGTLTFSGSANSPQLRPAKGMFIANKLVMNRPKLVVIYDALLNSPQGAPPGFTFTTSPSETQEGS